MLETIALHKPALKHFPMLGPHLRPDVSPGIIIAPSGPISKAKSPRLPALIAWLASLLVSYTTERSIQWVTWFTCKKRWQSECVLSRSTNEYLGQHDEKYVFFDNKNKRLQLFRLMNIDVQLTCSRAPIWQSTRTPPRDRTKFRQFLRRIFKIKTISGFTIGRLDISA